MSEGNGDARPAPVTFGAAAKRLRDNGWRPRSALDPREFISGPGIEFIVPDSALLSEHPAAVRVDVLVLRPIAHQELDKYVRVLLTNEGLLAGPVRLGSDGAEIRPLNLTGVILGRTSAVDGAVAIVRSANLPLDGHWPDGSPLERRRSDCPHVRIPESGLWPLFENELYFLPNLTRERRPQPKPSRLGFVGR